MDFYQLNTFYHVARKLNFTRAAEELSISQPAVSRQIESLEQHLGLTLFHRMGRSISLTDSGKTLYAYTEQILSLVERTKRAMEGMKNLESGSLSVGASSTIGNYFLAPVVAGFSRKYPSIHVDLEIDSTDSVRQKLEKGSVDLAIIAGPNDSTSLFLEPFLHDEIVLTVPPGHPLLSKEHAINETDFQKYRLILRRRGSNIRRTVEEHFAALGWTLSNPLELSSTEAIKQAVMAGAGISFLPRRAMMWETKCHVLQTIDVPNASLQRTFFIAHNKLLTPSPAALAFSMFLKRHGK